MSAKNGIKKALSKAGVSFVIQGTLSGEKCIYEIPYSTKNSFEREHYLEAILGYDTVVEAGNTLDLENSGRILVANKTPEILNDEIIYFETVFLKCNVISGEILRPSGEIWDEQTYHKVPVYSSIKAGIGGILTEANLSLNNENEFVLLSEKKLQLILSSSEDLRVMDRFRAKSGEFYRIETIKNYIYPNLIVAEIAEDIRE